MRVDLMRLVCKVSDIVELHTLRCSNDAVQETASNALDYRIEELCEDIPECTPPEDDEGRAKWDEEFMTAAETVPSLMAWVVSRIRNKPHVQGFHLEVEVEI